MVEIREEDWELLPEVPAGRDSVNLLPPVVDRLRKSTTSSASCSG